MTADFVAGSSAPSFDELAEELQSEMRGAAETIRSQTSSSLDTHLIEARRCSMSVLKYLESSFSHSGDRSESQNLRLLLIIAFVQGCDSVEELIVSGQYVKACPAIRQDYETITRLLELREGKGTSGTNPNIRNAPKGSQRFYGQLSQVTHPKDPARLLNFLRSWERDATGLVVSHVPHFVKPLAAYLFYIHVWLLFELTREALLLYTEMYGHGPSLDRAVLQFDKVFSALEAAGMTFDVAPGQGV